MNTNRSHPVRSLRTRRTEARLRRIQDPGVAEALRRLYRLVRGDHRPGRPEQLELGLGFAGVSGRGRA